VKESGGGFGDKGYQGTGLVTPKKKPKGGELSMSFIQNPLIGTHLGRSATSLGISRHAARSNQKATAPL
jgi:hypothetical protein